MFVIDAGQILADGTRANTDRAYCSAECLAADQHEGERDAAPGTR